MNKISIEECTSIANKLQLIPQPDNVGLSGGMMGQCLFYYWLHRKTHIEIYEKTAEKLLDAIVENINSTRPFRFEDGLAEIGWSIGHLFRHQFVTGEADEILEEVDRHARLYLLQTDFNLEWVAVAGLYFVSRYSNERCHEFTITQKRIKHDLLTLLLRFNFFSERTFPEVFVKYAKELDSSFAANNPLFKSLYILTQCYKSKVFNYRVVKLIRYFLKILIDCKEQMTSQNREYLCLLINDLKNALGEREDNICDFSSLEKDTEISNYKGNPKFFADESSVYLFTDNLFIPLISIKN